MLCKRSSSKGTCRSFLILVFSFTTAAHAATSDSATSTARQSSKAEMQEQQRPHVGVMAGFADPVGGQGSVGSFGIDIGYQPYVPFGLGLEIGSTQNEDFKRTDILVRGTYNFAGTTPIVKDSYVGVGIGPVFLSDGTALAAAPIVGFDIPLKNQDRYFLSLGANAKYEFVSGGSPNFFALSGVVKYWY